MNRRVRNVLWAVIAVVGVFAVISLFAGTFISASLASQIRNQQVTNTGTLSASEKSLERITDCTTLGRECYDRQQAQTADAVSNINRVVILAAACSVGVPADRTPSERERLIQSCVISRLSEDSKP